MIPIMVNGSMAPGMDAADGGVARVAHVSGFFAGLFTARLVRRW